MSYIYQLYSDLHLTHIVIIQSLYFLQKIQNGSQLFLLCYRVTFVTSTIYFFGPLQTTDDWQTSLFSWVEIQTGTTTNTATLDCPLCQREPLSNIPVKPCYLATWSALTRQLQLSSPGPFGCFCYTKYKCLATKAVWWFLQWKCTISKKSRSIDKYASWICLSTQLICCTINTQMKLL